MMLVCMYDLCACAVLQKRWGLLRTVVGPGLSSQYYTNTHMQLPVATKTLTSQTAQNAKMTNQPAVMIGEIGQLDDKERKRAIRGNPWVYGPIRIDITIKLASGSTVNYESWTDRNTFNANFYFQCLDFIYFFLGGGAVNLQENCSTHAYNESNVDFGNQV